MQHEYADIPGSMVFELPPLIMSSVMPLQDPAHVMEAAECIADDVLETSADRLAVPAGSALERTRSDLAAIFVQKYGALTAEWVRGDDILGWICQCETTFARYAELRPLLPGSVWPYADRSKFISLLEEKSVPVAIEPRTDVREVFGARLTFREPPPISCLTAQFFHFLESTMRGAYDTWASKAPAPVRCFPPDRFVIQVINISDMEAI